MLISDKLKSIDNFSKSEEVIANYILKEKESIKHLSTKDLANYTYTSPSTIVRFSQKLGFSGWNQLKEKFLEEVLYLNTHFSNIDPNFPFDSTDTLMTISSKISTLAIDSINDTLSLLNHDTLKKATDLMNNCRIINVYSTSSSLLMAYDFKHKMMCINKHVEIVNLPGEQIMVASNSSPEHCAIVISYSGQSKEVLKVAKKLKEKNTPIIVLTSIGENDLKPFGDCVFSLTTREKLYSKIAEYSSTNSIHLILDILYSCLFKMNYHENIQYKTNNSKALDDRYSNNILLKE